MVHSVYNMLLNGGGTAILPHFVQLTKQTSLTKPLMNCGKYSTVGRTMKRLTKMILSFGSLRVTITKFIYKMHIPVLFICKTSHTNLQVGKYHNLSL